VLSKRFLLRLVNEGHVRGWDDPRMPTISGLRRRGFPAEGIRDFAEAVGVTKVDSVSEYGQLEHSVRSVLNRTAQRRFGVIDPLKVVLTNYEVGRSETLDVVNNPEDASAGTRLVAFGREVWIEREDFAEVPPPKFFRLAPGREVRLRNAYFITCNEVVKDADGRIVELRCTYDPETRGGDAPNGRKPKATLHWVAAEHAVSAEVRLYDHLFTRPDPGAADDPMTELNPASETIVSGAMLESSLAELQVGETVQFERLGYFTPDPDTRAGALVFNRTLTLKDTWAKISGQPGAPA
jgi:glutaminyl-tRNA synthetase